MSYELNPKTRDELLLAKIAGEDVDIATLTPPVAINEKEKALLNIADKAGSVVSTEPQTFTEEQKAQVKENLGIEGGGVDPTIIDSDGKKLSEVGDVSVGWHIINPTAVLFNGEVIVTPSEEESEYNYGSIEIPSDSLNIGDYVRVTVFGNQYICKVRNDYSLGTCFGGGAIGFSVFVLDEIPFLASVSVSTIVFKSNVVGNINIKIEKIDVQFKKISENYIDNSFCIQVIENSTDEVFECDTSLEVLLGEIAKKLAYKPNYSINCLLYKDGTYYWLPLVRYPYSTNYRYPQFAITMYNNPNSDDFEFRSICVKIERDRVVVKDQVIYLTPQE